MPSGLKIYKIKDFIRRTESGEIDFDKSIQMVHELSLAAYFHKDHNILIDLRETTVSVAGVEKLMKIAMEFVECMPSFKNKIANVIPRNPNRAAVAKKFEECMNIKKYQYKFFTEYEHAIEWLSDVIS